MLRGLLIFIIIAGSVSEALAQQLATPPSSKTPAQLQSFKEWKNHQIEQAQKQKRGCTEAGVTQSSSCQQDAANRLEYTKNLKEQDYLSVYLNPLTKDSKALNRLIPRLEPTVILHLIRSYSPKKL